MSPFPSCRQTLKCLCLAYTEDKRYEFQEFIASRLVDMLADRPDTSNVMTGILSTMGTAYRIAMTDIFC